MARPPFPQPEPPKNAGGALPAGGGFLGSLLGGALGGAFGGPMGAGLGDFLGAGLGALGASQAQHQTDQDLLAGQMNLNQQSLEAWGRSNAAFAFPRLGLAELMNRPIGAPIPVNPFEPQLATPAEVLQWRAEAEWRKRAIRKWERPRATRLVETVRARTARFLAEARRELDLLAPEGRIEPPALTRWWEWVLYWLWRRFRPVPA
jgi:hypothetical protein